MCISQTELAFWGSEVERMASIGFRAEASRLTYAIAEGSVESPRIKNIDRVRAPMSYDLPEVLMYYRETCIDIIREYGATHCVIRTAEPNSSARGKGVIKRANAEGVLAEMSASIGIGCVMGPLATIGSRLGMNAKEARSALDAGQFRSVPRWPNLNRAQKEAVMAAIAGLA